VQLGDLVDALGTRIAAALEGDPMTEVTGVSHDSRRVVRGDLFCAVPGTRVDGHDHAAAAAQSGAGALLVERRLDVAIPQVLVPDVRAAMGPAASLILGVPSRSLRVFGVTGTNGKTTTTYLIESMARAAGMSAGVIGTIETRVDGVPLPAGLTTPEAPDLQQVLARMRDGGVGVVAMEVSSHALEFGRVGGTWFAAATFLNLSHDHLDFHGSLDAYFAAKARLFDPALAAVAVVNVADPYGARLVDLCRERELRTVTFAGAVEEAATTAGADTRADVRADDVRLGASGTTFTLVAPSWGSPRSVATNLVGSFNVTNAVAAAASALAGGMSLDAVAGGLAADIRVPGRFEPVDRGQDFTVVVDYAHTPDALAHALQAAREITQNRVLVVFGCGGDRDREKRAVMGAVAAANADVAYVTSDNPRSEDPAAIVDAVRSGIPADANAVVELDRRRAIERALADAVAGDVVVVAGKGHESGQIIGDTVRPFDDRLVVADLLEGHSCG